MQFLLWTGGSRSSIDSRCKIVYAALHTKSIRACVVTAIEYRPQLPTSPDWCRNTRCATQQRCTLRHIGFDCGQLLEKKKPIIQKEGNNLLLYSACCQIFSFYIWIFVIFVGIHKYSAVLSNHRIISVLSSLPFSLAKSLIPYTARMAKKTKHERETAEFQQKWKIASNDVTTTAPDDGCPSTY